MGNSCPLHVLLPHLLGVVWRSGLEEVGDWVCVADITQQTCQELTRVTR